MSAKNFNFFEQHVEKLALALAVVAAGWMIWTSLEPATITDASGKSIEIPDVEKRVGDAVTKLEEARKATLARKELSPQVPSYQGDYDKKMKTPLDNSLVIAAIPSFAPRQAPVVPANLTPSKVGHGLVITPTVPVPTELAGIAWRGTVHDPELPVNAAAGAAPVFPVAGGAPAAAGPKDTKDEDLVVVQGSLSLAKFAQSMTEVTIEQRLTGDAQKTIVYKIEAQRRSRVGNGWSEWVDVPAANSPPAPGNVPPVTAPQLVAAGANIDPLLDALKQSQKQITQPDSYITPDLRPVLKLLVRGDASLLIPDAAMPNAPIPTAVPPMPPAGATTTAPANVTTPFWLVDDHVVPGAEYQYQVRLVMFNPTFNWTIDGQPGKLADESKRFKAVIESEWVVVPNAVQVPDDMYFFVNGPIGGGQAGQQAISANVYKWLNGHWRVSAYAPAQPGTPITGKIAMPLPDHTILDVPTGHTVVDVIPGDKQEVQVVLLTPSGELTIRDSLSDSAVNNQRRKAIEEEIKKDKPAATTPPKKTTGGKTTGGGVTGGGATGGGTTGGGTTGGGSTGGGAIPPGDIK